MWPAASQTRAPLGNEIISPTLKPHSGHLFVFRGRRGGLIKVLWHDGQGMCLFAKRLERSRFISGGWRGDDLTGPAWLLARRHRLANAATHVATAGGRLIARFESTPDCWLRHATRSVILSSVMSIDEFAAQ